MTSVLKGFGKLVVVSPFAECTVSGDAGCCCGKLQELVVVSPFAECTVFDGTGCCCASWMPGSCCHLEHSIIVISSPSLSYITSLVNGTARLPLQLCPIILFFA
jgi:hypothetical protein